MVLLRSLIYYLLLFSTTAVYALAILLLYFFLPFSQLARLANSWGSTNLWLQRSICGLSYEISGQEHLTGDNALVFAKHQSAWETIALRALVPPEQAWVVKRELLWIPIFGWALAACEPIAIDRDSGRRAARQIIEQGERHLAAGRWVIIFPEGTRVAPGQRKKYGIGGGLLAERTAFPIIPIAHNAGVFWKRRGIRKYPGTIQVVVGAPLVTKGLKAVEITRRVEEWIESQVALLPVMPNDVGKRR